MLVTRICWRPRLVRHKLPRRGSTRSMIPSGGSVPSTGRNSTRSPAATTWRWSVLSVFRSRRVAHW